MGKFRPKPAALLYKDFVLICATDAPIWHILPILLIEKSVSYVFSMVAEAVPFQNIDSFRGSLK